MTERLILAPAGRRDAVVGLMRSAQRTLLLSIFRCDDFTIVDELAAAVKRGVHVRVLITQRARGWKEKLKELTLLLRSLGADVRPYEAPAVKYHAKYIVADDGPALVTTLNFTRKCFENTCDFVVLSHDADVVSGLKTLFEYDCTATPASSLPQLSPRLVIGPGSARQRYTEILSAAATDIRIIDHRVNDPRILGLLAEKQRQGVSLQVLGNGPMGGLMSHGRMMLIDRRAAVIGSIHLSASSLDSRREVAIVIEEPSLVSQLYEYFEGLAKTEANIMNLWAAPSGLQQNEDDEEDE